MIKCSKVFFFKLYKKQKHKHYLSVNGFLTEKEKAVKKKTKHEKYTPMRFELLMSQVTIQHVSH